MPDERVLAFPADLLRRWPLLADQIAPWHDDLGSRRRFIASGAEASLDGWLIDVFARGSGFA